MLCSRNWQMFQDKTHISHFKIGFSQPVLHFCFSFPSLSTLFSLHTLKANHIKCPLCALWTLESLALFICWSANFVNALILCDNSGFISDKLYGFICLVSKAPPQLDYIQLHWWGFSLSPLFLFFFFYLFPVPTLEVLSYLHLVPSLSPFPCISSAWGLLPGRILHIYITYFQSYFTFSDAELHDHPLIEYQYRINDQRLIIAKEAWWTVHSHSLIIDLLIKRDVLLIS